MTFTSPIRARLWCAMLVGLIMAVSVPSFAQHSDWNVRYYVGKFGLKSIEQCELLSVSSDTLTVRAADTVRYVSLFNLYEISRPDTGRNFAKPIWMGALIGGGIGLLGSSLVLRDDGERDWRKAENARNTVTVTALFSAAGAGLGLLKATASDSVTYRFREISNPEKQEQLQRIIGEDRAPTGQ
ncbi:MAG: hypothetical protein HY961_13245 [Ignavibacteriae bacterium]|nr:hypothetical protein [Ignavibacteriota bacterium]